MAAVDRKPILFTDGLVDVTYMCDWCGTETKRAVREPGRAGRARNGESGDAHRVRTGRQRIVEYEAVGGPEGRNRIADIRA